MTEYQARTTYVMRDGKIVPKDTATPYRGESGPQIMKDIPDYRSPIDGRLITSRSHRREDLKRNNCVEVDPPKGGSRGYRNPTFAIPRGLKLREG